MEEQEFNWKDQDFKTIYAKDWHIDHPKAVIALVHGLGEHCNRYDHLGRFFTQNQIALVGYDRIGHGKSEGKRGHMKSFERYMNEIKDLLEQIRKRYSTDIPIFLYGHSMGGNLVLNYLLRNNPDIQGLIATGSWIQLPPGKEPKGLFMFILKVIKIIYPSLTQPNGLDPSHIARVEEEVIKYKKDQLVHDRISVNTALGMLKAAKYLDGFQGQTQLPTLIMHGTDDQITAPEGSKSFTERVQGNITFKPWDSFYHEIHNEAEKQEVFDYVLSWIEQHLDKK